MNSRSAVQKLLDELLWDLYGRTSRRGCVGIISSSAISGLPDSWKYSQEHLLEMNILALTQLSASLRIEIRIIGSYLTRVLIARDKYLRVHEDMCSVITAYLTTLSLQLYAETKEMRFSLSPPPPQLPGGCDPDTSPSSSDFDQWLHAMKMVARLPGGMPPEFRRKLWLALSEKYLQTRNVSWEQEEAKCFSEQWREDDEELGIQIVKDLHRTGSSLCSGPAGTINQAKLKRVLLGYARWNPEVGYCQGFNMLGALILQVMDKSESESMKVMIFLIEGVLPPGYFSGSLGGLQADMAVFRELMTSKLPKLAKHLQKLQGRNPEDSFEPPLTNVFTMQWFLTLFCTCLPINCVFRVWDLTLIEGSDVLLRTALAIWSLLEDKILCSKTADDFYCKMGTLSGELLNGHLIDSNGLIEKVVELGPVPELQKLRDKHLYNIAPWRDQKGLKLYYSDEDGDSDDDSRLAVTTAWGLRLNRRGSIGIPTSSKQITENKDRLALDISLLKKQYERLRERQRQAHIIITATVARQAVSPMPTPSLQVNQLLMGRPPIISNRARLGPPKGSIPPPRKVPGPSKPVKPVTKQTKRGETLHWRDTEVAKRRKGSIKWKDVNIPSYDETDESDVVETTPPPPPPPPPPVLTSSPARSRRKSESSSYSEDSDPNSSTSTSLCDEEDNENADTACSSLEASPRRKLKTPDNEVPKKDDLGDISKLVSDTLNDSLLENVDRTTFGQIPLIELTGSKITFDKNQEEDDEDESQISSTLLEEDSTTECDRFGQNTPLSNFVDLTTEADDRKSLDNTLDKIDSLSASLTTSLTSPIDKCNNFLDVSKSPLTITSTSQLSPIADISKYLSSSSISPLRTPTSYFDYADIATSTPKNNEEDEFNVNEDGVTNEYFERVSLERPTRLDLLYSYNEEKTETDKDEKDLEEELSTECKNEEQEIKVIDLDFEKPGLPSVTPEAQHSINCSLNIKTEEDTVVESLDTHSELKEHTECRASSSVGSIFNHSIGKEKSFSFDDTAVVEKFEPRPTSCPEARSNLMEEKTHSDRVLKIIEENSLILHRILRKSVPDGDSPTCNKENYEEIFAMPKIEKEASETIEKECTKNSPVKCEIEIREMDDFMPTKKYDDHYGDKFTTSFRANSRILDLSSIQLRSDDSIADRLASIKNTIKSIDSLCEDKESYKKEKCQKYIDSLFKTTSREPPSIKINEIESLTTATNLRASPILFSEGKNLNDSYSAQSRSYRDIRREISPRRRRDEDREEYESRARRDKMPNDSQREYELSSVNIFSKLDSKNEDFYEKIKCDKKFDDYRVDSDNSIASFTNHTVKGSEFDIQSAVPTVYVPAKINIRHTTVTSTFYDRYLSQKRERNATTKIDSNPLSSPIITRSYLDTLKPTSYSSYSRNTKSAENSPSREKFDSPIAYTTTPTKTSTNQSNYFHLPDNELHVRSCDNILLRLKTSPTSNITPSVATDIHQPQPIYNPLPTKVKKPSEIGIQLGLYKSPTNNFPTS